MSVNETDSQDFLPVEDFILTASKTCYFPGNVAYKEKKNPLGVHGSYICDLRDKSSKSQITYF